MKELIAKELASLTNLSVNEILNLIEIPPSYELGDFSFPCFLLAKSMKKNPIEIAQDLSKKFKSNAFEKVESKGAYLNFFVSKKDLVKRTIEKILKEKDKYGSQKLNKKIVIEFPSPNTNKPLHIGHARNIVFGQSIVNMLNFFGNKVDIVNLNNDRGIHICKSMVAYDLFGKGDSPSKKGIKSDHFVGDYYVKFAQELVKNPDLEKKAQEYLLLWEKGDKKIHSLWKKMNSWAFNGFSETYKKFGYKPDKEYFESKIFDKGKETIMDALKKGNVKRKDDNAIFIDLSKEGLGEKILLRADGTSIYVTQDIYLAILKHKDFDFDKSIFISASEQNYHFKVLFLILKKLGYSWADKLQHLSYGMVNLESGRMKSREGNVVDSDELISELVSIACEELDKRYDNLKQKEKKERSEKIAMAALRYYYLKIDGAKDITFKPEESISFEGNTGPYLLYTYARAKSILSKVKYKPSKISFNNISDKEKNLILSLGRFPEKVDNAASNLSPNIIANYAYELSQYFNEFYHSDKVIGSENEKQRLLLVHCFSIVLKNALKLLGIETIEKM